jgi:hypothetical protein
MPAYDASLFDPPAPVARVTLRNLSDGAAASDVLMLIDSGAEVTLVPRLSADQLGLRDDSGETCELMGFDGSMSVSQVVELDLIFLRRAFRGRYLIIDQECGILGRDVLNHITLLLDGPRLNWDEKKDE